MLKRIVLIGVFIFCAGAAARAERVAFVTRELFRVPFGQSRETLGAQVEGNNFIVPRNFTLDGLGHCYIYDSTKHRVARYSSAGKFEMELRYPATAEQVFAHADAQQNLWIIVSDPQRGLYYGVYDSHGKRLRAGQFEQFNTFRFHVDDQGVLHLILSSTRAAAAAQTYLLDAQSLLLKKENVAPPPENHHRLRRNDRTYFLDAVPGTPSDDGHALTRITGPAQTRVAEIQGKVIYMTAQGDIYTRVGKREIHIYDAGGALKGKVFLQGLPASMDAIRFDPEGNIYELDGVPDADGRYTPAMTGMRLIQWERQP